MINYFNIEELDKIKRQKNKVLLIYFITLGVCLACLIPCLIWYWRLPFMHPNIKLVKAIVFVIAGVYTVYSCIYLGIKHARVKKYYKLCYNMATGIQEEYIGEFLRYSEDIEQKDGVDCKSLIFKEWNKYKKHYFERKVLVFYEKEFPQLIKNKIVRYVVQGNMLLEYEYVEEKGEQICEQ